MSDTKPVTTDSEAEEEIDIVEEKDDEEVKKTLCDKTENEDEIINVEKDSDGLKSKSVEHNGFSAFHHRLTDKYLKRKYPEFEDSDEDEEEGKDRNSRNFTHKRALTEEAFAHRIRQEQLFPMDASLRALNDSGLGMHSISNKHSISSATSTSRCEDRLKPPGPWDRAIPGSSSVEASPRPVCSKEEPKLQLHKPSFLITDILSSDSSRKERETVHSVFTDPRLFGVSHRNFLDRQLPGALSPGQDRGLPRFDDDDNDSDYDDDDKSESDGKY